MAEKDKAGKKLEDYADVFADIYNVLLFNKEYIKEDKLEAGPTESIYKAEEKYKEQFRDILKNYQGINLEMISLGLENQASVDADMPVRVMGYDYASYRSQIDAKKKLHPVLTIVLNLSKKDWNKPTHLLGMFNLDESLKPYVQDYKISVFDIHKLDLKTIRKFKSDFKYIAAFFKYGRDYLVKFSDDETLMHPEEVMDFIRVFSKGNMETVEKDLLIKVKKGGRITMCNIVQEIQDSARQEGIEKGIEKGIEVLILDNLEEGISEPRIITKLENRFHLTKEEAECALEKYRNA